MSVRVLEEVLPGRFGGSPTDYQIVESPAGDGMPRITLLVHPRLGPLDERSLADAFLASLAPGDGGEHLMGVVWRQGDVLRVDRRPPIATSTGKIQHFVLTAGGVT
jgi:hypothetical protein